jgi:iron complex transport system substrate-binding protein
MLFAIGTGDRLVGVGAYDNYPTEARRLPRLGGLLDPDVERLLALKPDLVVLYSTQIGLRRQLERASVPMFLYQHRGLADITATLRSLGARVGATGAANHLADQIDGQLADIRRRVAGRPRPKTLLVIGRDSGTLRTISASGGYGFLHDMLEVAGASDALADIKRESIRVSIEMLLARAPEVVIELHYGGELTAERLALERRAWSRLPSLPAVRSDRVYVLDGDEFVVPGPRIAAATERLARLLHPEAFGGRSARAGSAGSPRGAADRSSSTAGSSANNRVVVLSSQTPP